MTNNGEETLGTTNLWYRIAVNMIIVIRTLPFPLVDILFESCILFIFYKPLHFTTKLWHNVFSILEPNISTVTNLLEPRQERWWAQEHFQLCLWSSSWSPWRPGTDSTGLSVTLCLEYSRHHTLLGSLLSPGWGKLQNTFYQQMESTLENLLENSLEKCFKNISSISNSKY